MYNSRPLVPITSQVNPVHAPHPTSLRSILMLSSIYAWVFQVVSFLCLLTKTMYSSPDITQVINQKEWNWRSVLHMWGRVEMRTEFWWGKWREWDHFQDVRVGRKMILKWNKVCTPSFTTIFLFHCFKCWQQVSAWLGHHQANIYKNLKM